MISFFSNTNEYYVKEVDERRSRANRSLIGTEWSVKRYISRVGYKYNPKTLDYGHVRDEAEKILLETFESGLDLNLSREEKERISKNILKEFRSDFRYLPVYQANGRLMSKLTKEEPEAKWRRIWFCDFLKEFPYHETRTIKIVDTKSAWTGEPYSSESWQEPYSGEWDYTPGGLDPAFYQHLYIANLMVETKGGLVIEKESIIVYPEDLIAL
jgi:hypothetical protein